MKILRVFIRKTSYTPIDDYVRIGSPDLFIPKDIQQIHISTLFTWDKQQAREFLPHSVAYYIPELSKALKNQTKQIILEIFK